MLEMGAGLEKAIAEIRERKARLVAIQAPEGLKTRVAEIAGSIESQTQAKTAVFVNPVFGACMLADDAAKKIGADLLLHFGHTQFFRKESIPTLYIPVRYAMPEEIKEMAFELAAKKLSQAGIKSIGLTGTIQFVPYLEELKSFLEKQGILGVLEKEANMQAGQILGCNYSVPVKEAEKAEAILYFGDGLFHPLGIAFSTSKRVFICNPLTTSFQEITGEKEKFLKKRIGLIGAGLQAKKFGFLVSTEKGQFGLRRAIQLKQKLEEQGKQAIIVVSDLVKPEYVLGIEVDIWVNTACPRIATDDTTLFKKPVLTASELKIVLGEKSIEEYKVEEIV